VKCGADAYDQWSVDQLLALERRHVKQTKAKLVRVTTRPGA
jgi:hypothetical protein